LARLALAFLIVLGPASGWFGFVPLSGSLLAAMAAVTVAYLSAAEVAKHLRSPAIPDGLTSGSVHQDGSGADRAQ
jgi:hypothetical protein